jgi:hypothetical protein
MEIVSAPHREIIVRVAACDAALSERAFADPIDRTRHVTAARRVAPTAGDPTSPGA